MIEVYIYSRCISMYTYLYPSISMCYMISIPVYMISHLYSNTTHKENNFLKKTSNILYLSVINTLYICICAYIYQSHICIYIYLFTSSYLQFYILFSQLNFHKIQSKYINTTSILLLFYYFFIIHLHATFQLP